MNENLEKGSMLPIIDLAMRDDFDVLVMNPNYNRDPITRVNIIIIVSSSKIFHFLSKLYQDQLVCNLTHCMFGASTY